MPQRLDSAALKSSRESPKSPAQRNADALLGYCTVSSQLLRSRRTFAAPRDDVVAKYERAAPAAGRAVDRRQAQAVSMVCKRAANSKEVYRRSGPFLVGEKGRGQLMRERDERDTPDPQTHHDEAHRA